MIAAGLVLVLGAWLRFYQLDQYPLGFNQDELSDAYDAYAIVETGADRFGDRYPAILRAYGDLDYRPALYSWLAAIPVKLSGFSITAGRIPSAVLGTASLVLLFLFANAFAGQTFALLALLVGALSPWHIQYSRIGVESGSLVPFLIVLTLYLWLRSESRNFPLLLVAALGFTVGFSTNAYQGTRVTAFLFAVVITIDMLRLGRQSLSRIAVFALAVFVGALPQIVTMLTQPTQFFARATVLTAPVESPLVYAGTLIWNYWLNIAPRYLFVPREITALTVARLLPPEILFFYVGLVALALRRVPAGSRVKYYVYAALVISILPSALSTGNPDPLRASGMAILTPLFTAAGIIFFYERLSRLPRLERAYYPAVVSVLIAASGIMVYRYGRSLMFREAGFQHFLVQLDTRVGRHQSAFDAVIVERYGSQRHLYTAAFTGMTPREFQKAPKRMYSDGMDHFTRIGKYYFVPRRQMKQVADNVSAQPGKFLFVSSEQLPGLRAIDSVSFREEKAYLLARP